MIWREIFKALNIECLESRRGSRDFFCTWEKYIWRQAHKNDDMDPYVSYVAKRDAVKTAYGKRQAQKHCTF